MLKGGVNNENRADFNPALTAACEKNDNLKYRAPKGDSTLEIPGTVSDKRYLSKHYLTGIRAANAARGCAKLEIEYTLIADLLFWYYLHGLRKRDKYRTSK